MNNSLTVAAQRKSGRAKLEEHSLQPDRDIDALLCDLLELSRAQLYTQEQRILTPDEISTLNEQTERLQQGEPLAYIRGQEEFWSLTLNITPKVLIPRPDTELLVEVALAALAELPTARVLDLGTGSGAVALALASSRPQDTIVATDVSAAALDVARSNTERLSLSNVSLVQSDWYRNLRQAPFDVIVSNPPYIDLQDPNIAASVREYEPHAALFADNHGLAAITQIIAGAKAHLAPRGVLFIEHGWRQHTEVGACLREYGYGRIASHRDLAGHYRVTGGSIEE